MSTPTPERNVKVLISEMKAELAELKAQKANGEVKGQDAEVKKGKKSKKGK